MISLSQRSLLLCAIIVLTQLVGCSPSATESASIQAKGKLVSVKTVAAIQTEVERSTQQPATVYPFFETAIRPRVSGYVSEISADIGDFVSQGDLLARVDVPELSQRRQKLAAQVDLLVADQQAAEAGVRLAEASVQSARARNAQAKSQLARSQASLEAAEAEFKRTEDLVNRGSLQNRILDEVRKKRDSERAAREAVVAEIAAAEAEVGVMEAESAAAEARLRVAHSKTEVARHELGELQVLLDFANVTAPFAGLVTQRHVDLGDLVEGRSSDRTDPLFVVSMVDKVRVQIPVPEVDAPFVQLGERIALTFPSFIAEPPIEATITRRSGSLDPSTRTMTVEAEIANGNGKLLPGMFGQATITLESQVSTTRLPSRAVRFDESGRAFVYLLDGDNRVKLVDVMPGVDTGVDIEILSGVRPGDIVIGPHLKRFREGEQVRPL